MDDKDRVFPGVFNLFVKPAQEPSYSAQWKCEILSSRNVDEWRPLPSSVFIQMIEDSNSIKGNDRGPIVHHLTEPVLEEVD